MRYHLLILMFLFSISCIGQWTTLNIPQNNRYDDIFFIDDQVGWVVGGSFNQIYKTSDGGLNWSLQFTNDKYLRSIVFASPTLGFCGSLDSSFFRTTDGGATWLDISNSIVPKPPGICGLSAPSSDVIYGCGIWSSPAYLIKSADGGNTWTYIDLSSMAFALVDVFFLNEDTGFVCGMANPTTDGAVILSTVDGGITWDIKYKTFAPQEYIWKLQSPDSIHIYGSVESLPVSGNVRMVRSNDAGLTWQTDTIMNTYSYIQTIGFLDTLQGWIGGNSTLFETVDGGVTWNAIVVGTAYNRFFKVNDSTAFMSGDNIYKYTSGDPNDAVDVVPYDEIHVLKVFPNPASDYIEVEIDLRTRTNIRLELFSSDGRLLKQIFAASSQKGVRKYSISLLGYAAQSFYVILRTNEGLIWRKVTKA